MGRSSRTSQLHASARILAVLGGVALAQPAIAGAVSPSVAVEAAQVSRDIGEPLALVADNPPIAEEAAEPARITIGKAASGEGRPMYGWRRAFGDSAAVISFSTRRPRYAALRSGGSAVLPAVITPGAVGRMPRYFPVAASAMTSGFGARRHPILGIQRGHAGVDLAAPWGAPIAATADGVVSFANWYGGYGLLVALDNGGGIQTRYGHMSRVVVTPGQRVRTGQILGYIGSTGLSTGPHVHYEVRVNGQAVNPYSRK